MFHLYFELKFFCCCLPLLFKSNIKSKYFWDFHRHSAKLSNHKINIIERLVQFSLDINLFTRKVVIVIPNLTTVLAKSRAAKFLRTLCQQIQSRLRIPIQRELQGGLQYKSQFMFLFLSIYFSTALQPLQQITHPTHLACFCEICWVEKCIQELMGILKLPFHT